jgi:CRP-like cAMP-binding protein
MPTEAYSFLGDRDEVVDNAKALSKVPFFEALGQEYVSAVARHSKQVHAQPGTVIIEQNAPGAEFVLIMSGSVRVEKDGKPISKPAAGDFFGELALLDGESRSASVIADEECTLTVVQKDVFDALLRDVPGLERKLLLVLASRLRSRGDRPLA